MGLRVWLWYPDVSWRLSLPGTLGGRSRSVGGASGARTLHFLILHEQSEGVAQRGTHGLSAAEEQIVCGHQQSIHDEVAQRVLLFLQGLRARDVSQGGGRSLGAETLRPTPRRPAQLLLGASSAPPLFNFLSLGDLGSAESRVGKISAKRPIKQTLKDFLMSLLIGGGPEWPQKSPVIHLHFLDVGSSDPNTLISRSLLVRSRMEGQIRDGTSR